MATDKMPASEAGTIAALAVKANGAHTVDGKDGRQFLMTPDGFRSEEITDPHGLKPRLPSYISQAVTVQTVDSLVDYVNRFKGANTVLFADIAASAILGAIDFHPPADKAVDGARAGHVAHRATLTLPFSEEWRLWSEFSGKLKGQLEFARFLEENAGDVTAPPGAELLEVTRDLQANRKVNFIKAVRTSSENEDFEFSSEANLTAKGSIEIPTKFQLKIPIYFGEPPTELYAYLRWKIDPEEGGLTLGVQLSRAEQVRQAVFKQIVIAVGDRAACPVVYGKL